MEQTLQPPEKRKTHRIWRIAVWIIGSALVLSVYAVVSQPDDPLNRLQGIHIVDDHKVVVGKLCMRILKVEADEIASSKSVVNTFRGNMPWYPQMFKPRPMGDYCTYVSADGKYDITITPGGSGVYTQISENRPAGIGERVSAWLESVLDNFGSGRA